MIKLLIFTGPDCPACVKSNPIVLKATSDYCIKHNINIDVRFTLPEDNITKAAKYGVTILPTYVLIKNNKTIAVTEGFTDEAMANLFLDMLS